MTGIRERYYVDDHDHAENPAYLNEYMGAEAAKQAIANAGLEPRDIDHIIYATFTSRMLVPSSACIISKFIDFENYSGIVVNGACSGFLDGLLGAISRTSSGMSNHVLVVGSECLSDIPQF